MPRWRLRALYFVLIPAICVAAGVLGYYTWVTASRFTQLGEQTIADNTLLLVREKVETIEQLIIDQDNAALRRIDWSRPERITETWLPDAETLTPSVRALLILDDTGNIAAAAIRGTEREQRQLRKVFVERVLSDLELHRMRAGRLKHLHERYGGESVLVSFKAYRIAGRRWYAVAQHDPAYIVESEFPRLFATEEGKRQYNVVGGDNRRVYGPSLSNAGDYLVGLRFPTTLYQWRLQLAPKQAPQLERQGRSRRATDIALLGIAFLVILLGAFFLLYAAYKERKLNDLKGEFVANVSHELKTPLSSVRMFGDLLLRDLQREGGKKLPDAKRRQYLELIVQESERLTSLIENVLDFAALERGRQQVEMREGPLQEVVGRAIETFRHRVEREGVEIELAVEGTLPPVMLDEQAVLLAVINLLDNAMKYGDKTPITVTLERVRDFVQVRVRDRGPGIPTDAERRVFERFYRAGADGTIRGSGIGLTLVKQIAVAHGGRAWAKNAEGGGAMVAFAIPALPEAEAARLETAQQTSL